MHVGFSKKLLLKDGAVKYKYKPQSACKRDDSERKLDSMTIFSTIKGISGPQDLMI